MRKIYYHVGIGFAGCDEDAVIEVDDDATDAEINEIVHEAANEWAASWEGDERLGWDYDEMSEEEVADYTTEDDE